MFDSTVKNVVEALRSDLPDIVRPAQAVVSTTAVYVVELVIEIPTEDQLISHDETALVSDSQNKTFSVCFHVARSMPVIALVFDVRALKQTHEPSRSDDVTRQWLRKRHRCSLM